MRHSRPFRLAILLLCGFGGLCGGWSAGAAARDLPVTRLSLPLPGAPSELLAADLDGDARRDLLLFVAWSHWGEVGIEEETRLDDVAGLVEVMTVVPALLDRRELWLYRGDADGGLATEPVRLEVGRTVHALAVGPSFAPALVLTDDGMAAVRWRPTEAANGRLELEPLVAERTVLAGTELFVAGLSLSGQIDGAGDTDLLVPVERGLAIYLAETGGKLRQSATVELPLDDPRDPQGRLVRNYPLPERRDLDGDGLPELLVQHPRRGWNEAVVLKNLGGGRFGPPRPAVRGLSLETHGKAGLERDVVFVGDLDGDSRAEAMTAETHEPGSDASLGEGLDRARRPRFRYRLLRLDADFAARGEPFGELEAEGHFIDGGESIGLPSGLQDLDGDGRLDLVTLTLDFSILQAARVLATKRISIGVDFLVHCQSAPGRFRRVPGLDLSGKFQIDLDDLRLGRLSQFAGDFDGDGRLDFLQLGRGRKASVHRGGPGCTYPTQPDFELDLVEEPRDLALTRVADWNGDGRADLAVVRPLAAAKDDPAGADVAVALDLYLSHLPGAK